MEKITKQFFDGGVVICGCADKDNLYYKRLHKAFTAHSVKVFPMPTVPESPLDFPTYAKLEDLPEPPACAYILSDKTEVPELVEQLALLGVKKLLFYSKADVDEATLEDCSRRGIETRLGCPLMLFCAGFCWLHGKLAGVKR